MYLLILEWAAIIGTIEFAAKAEKIAWTSDKWLYIVATGKMQSNLLQRLGRLLGHQISAVCSKRALCKVFTFHYVS